MKSLTNTLLVLFQILLIVSCQKEEVVPEPPYCPDKVDLGEFYMVESSKDFLPYDENVHRLIFSDSSGIEYIAERTKYTFGTGYVYFTRENPCEADTSQKFHYIAHTERKSINFVFESDDIKLLFRLAASVYPNYDGDMVYESDAFNVVVVTPISSSKPHSQIGGTVNPKNYPLGTKTLPNSDSFNIHDKTFLDVYHSTYEDEHINIYYTEKEGLVALETTDKSISLKFERVE